MTSKVWLYVIGRGIYKVERFSYVIGCGVNVIKRPGCTFPHWPTKASDRLVWVEFFVERMEDRRCFSCRSILSAGDRFDQRAYRRNCCSIFMHHDCILSRDLTNCPSCGSETNGLIWEPLPVVKEPCEVILIIDSSDEEDNDEDPIPCKRFKQEEQKIESTCVFCLEEEKDKQDPLLQAECCRQFGHLSCLRLYYRVPAECKNMEKRNEAAKDLEALKCFVCRKERSNEVVGLRKVIPTLLPRVTGRDSVMTARDANKVLDVWYAMFEKHINTQTKLCKHWMRIDGGTGWAMRRDGNIEMFEFPCSTQAKRIGAFREELMKSIKKMVRVWAGLTSDTKFKEETFRRFCLDNIVEVTLSFQLSQSCTLRRRPQGQEVPPFCTESYLARLCTWEMTGHFFDLDEIVDSINSKCFVWDNKRLR